MRESTLVGDSISMAIEVPNSLGQPITTTNGSNNCNGQEKIISNGHSGETSAYPSSSSTRSILSINTQFLPIIGLFIFYIAHDALQERMFRYDGFEFGFFMTLVEVLVMLVGSIMSEGGVGINAQRNVGKKRTLSIPVLIRIGWVGLFLALAHGLGNTSLNYSPYPLKVAFKSCKLVPTMAMGACVTGRQFTVLQYSAALIMGMGLAVLTAADVFNSKQSVPLANSHDDWSKEIGPFIGPILLTISTVFDSIVPNLQEQLLQRSKVKTSEMILVSNMVMCLVLVVYTLYSGELVSAWSYCTIHKDASGVLLLQGLCAYLGLKSYLAIIRDYGGVIGVLLANARKVVTIILSFILFAKPFNDRHVVGLMLVFVGVYLGYISKKGKNKEEKGDGKISSSSPGRKRKGKKKKSGADDDSHEHNV